MCQYANAHLMSQVGVLIPGASGAESRDLPHYTTSFWSACAKPVWVGGVRDYTHTYVLKGVGLQALSDSFHA